MTNRFNVGDTAVIIKSPIFAPGLWVTVEDVPNENTHCYIVRYTGKAGRGSIAYEHWDSELRLPYRPAIGI